MNKKMQEKFIRRIKKLRTDITGKGKTLFNKESDLTVLDVYGTELTYYKDITDQHYICFIFNSDEVTVLYCGRGLNRKTFYETIILPALLRKELNRMIDVGASDEDT